MTEPARLERGYRRLLGWYPKQFRQEHGEEILAVLMDGADPAQRRPRMAESADLLRSALSMRLNRGAPRSTATKVAARRLMYLGAALELATLVTVVVTAGQVRTAIAARDGNFSTPQWHAVLVGHIAPLVAVGAVAVGLWLWMAWANGGGRRWARFIFATFFGLTTLSLLAGLVQGSATYATADLISGVALWLVALAVLVLIFQKGSRSHYEQGLSALAARPQGPSAVGPG